MLNEQGGCSLAGDDDDVDASGFAELGLAPGLCRALSGLGYEEPTPIQRAAVPPLIAGRDLVGQAATGQVTRGSPSRWIGTRPGAALHSAARDVTSAGV